MSFFATSPPVAPARRGPNTEVQTSLMAELLGALFSVGATLALLTVILPHSSSASVGGVFGVVGCAYLMGGTLVWWARSIPRWLLQIVLAAGSTMITAVCYLSAGNPSPLVFFYLWVFLYCSYFFSRRQMLGHIAYVAALFAALMALRAPASEALSWWIVSIGTLTLAAVLVQVMRRRVELLISRLYDAARTDPLTKLSNRRGFRERLDQELERARRGETSIAVLVGDIDHFKEVNDRSGHHVGDAALCRVAALLQSGKRQIDGVARLGGEEFALILPDADAQTAFVLAERLRQRCAEEFADDTVPITISFGIASYPGHGESGATLLQAADEALYAAKESGRNRTVIHGPALGELAVTNGPQEVEAERFTAVVLDLAEAVDLRFGGSVRHSETVGRYAEMMARELNLPERRVARVRLAGMLHDVGKVGVPDTILSKKGPLTEQELELVKRHPELGAQILEHPSLADVRVWVANHHERPDGRGYPRGICGPDLPMEARIIAVADAYEAMTSDRPHRGSIGHQNARSVLRRNAGTQFDVDVVRAFLAVLERESERAEVTLSGGQLVHARGLGARLAGV